VNIKMNDFVGYILQNKFYACCYILLPGTRPKRRCTPICGVAMLLRCNWCRNLATISVRRGGWEGGRPPCLEKFQGKLCFQGKRKLLKILNDKNLSIL